MAGGQSRHTAVEVASLQRLQARPRGRRAQAVWQRKKGGYTPVSNCLKPGYGQPYPGYIH
jgi:hypothetical protein